MGIAMDTCLKGATGCLASPLLERFIGSRPEGLSKKTIQFYRYTLTGFVGYDLTPDGVALYLKSLICKNAKLRFYQSLKILLRWLLRNGYISDNPMEKVFST